MQQLKNKTRQGILKHNAEEDRFWAITVSESDIKKRSMHLLNYESSRNDDGLKKRSTIQGTT
jgi:hypothetical protein